MEGLSQPDLPELGLAERKQHLAEFLVQSIASQLHDDWRSAWRAANSNKPRIKPTKDTVWIQQHRTNEVDIASTPYSELPSEWQQENRQAAEVVTNLVLNAVKNNRPLDELFVETAADEVHGCWLQRNGSWATDIQKRPYAELPEEEKEKDRIQVRAAIDAYKRL